MKVNLKKIGAVVAGIALVASSVAFAGLMYGNTVLVNDNGVPKVKVVVGQNAMATDGVAAANIAARIASSAYTQQTYTATVDGVATATGGSSSCGAQTCAITDKSVTLDIQTPGDMSAPGVIETLLGDYVDKTLLDRRNNTYANSYYSSTYDDSDNAGPFANGKAEAGLVDGEDGYTYLYKIDANKFSPLQSTTVTDPVSGDTYTETQALWLNGYSAYDSGEDGVTFRPNKLVYSVKFDDGDRLGIPGNTKGFSVSGGTDYRDSGSSTHTGLSDYDTSTHMVHINFLGSDWIISDMSAGSKNVSGNLTSYVDSDPSAYVTLAKEAVPTAVLYANDPNHQNYLEIDGYHFVLNDVQAETDVGTSDAIITVTDADGNPVSSTYTRTSVSPGNTKDVTINGKTYKLHVFSTTKGFSGMSATARMSIFSQELELKDGNYVDQGNSQDNKHYKVVLGWKNKDNGDYVDTLRSINLYADDTSDVSSTDDDYLSPGDYMSVLQSPVTWKIGFNGVDLDSTMSDYRDGLTFDHNDGSKTIKGDEDGDVILGTTTTNYDSCALTDYVVVSSDSDSNVFTTTNGNAQSSTFYVSLANVTCTGGTGGDQNYSAGTVLMSDSSGTHYYIQQGVGSTITTSFNTGADPGVIYTKLSNGDTYQKRGGIYTYYNGDSSSGVYNYTAFRVVETISDPSDSQNYRDAFEFLYDGGSDDQFESWDASHGGADDKVWFTTNALNDNKWGGDYSNGTVDEGFISMRGSKFVSIGDNTVKFNMAEKLGHALLTVTDASANTTTTSAGTVETTLKEGESWPATGTHNGFKVTVKSIDATGTCSAGTSEGAAGSCDMSGVSALISPDNTATVTGYVPTDYSTYKGMVVTDNEVSADSTDVLIAVGGPAVNTVSANYVSADDLKNTSVMVKEVDSGKKIVVAGYTAEDTLNAANQFISGMQ